MKFKDAVRFAVRNVAKHGDTDVIPYPIDNVVFFDKEGDVAGVIESIHKHKNLDVGLAEYPIVFSKTLAAVGYHGFRSAMQIDPLWNAYLLSLVISIGDKIEQARIPINRHVIYSYRFAPDSEKSTLFDLNTGWRQFQERSVELARSSQYVLSCDISDFYSRIYHHRIENALKIACPNNHAVTKVMKLLGLLSGGASYGLPVGGHAARILAELLLNRTDRLLMMNQVQFCRFVDDYRIFAASKEEAYSALIILSSLLLNNEGLSLQKSKTRLVSSSEYLKTSGFAAENKSATDGETEVSKFLEIRIKYDPYSDSADSDYEMLRDQLRSFDIVGMLGKELSKGRVDEALTKQLIKSAKLMGDDVKSGVAESLINNLDVLYPVFPTVMIFLKSVLPDLDEITVKAIHSRIRRLIAEKSYITKVPNNLAYSIRVLASDPSDDADCLLSQQFRESDNSTVRRDIILSMANRGNHAWISDCRNAYPSLASWERRALLIASYVLEDEGHHWRESLKRGLNPYDRLLLEWASERKVKKVKGLPL